MQVGDALVGVDHVQRRAVLQVALDGGLHGRGGAAVELVQAVEDGADAVVRRQVHRRQLGLELGVHRREEGLDDLAEDQRVGHLHHGGLQVHGEQDVLALGLLDLRLEEGRQDLGVDARAVDDLALQDRHVLLQDDGVALVGLEDVGQLVVAVHDHGLLVVAEVVGGHGGDVGLGVRGPGAHAVRVLAGEVLHGLRRAAVGVALAQHRVDGGTLDLVELGAVLAVLFGLRLRQVLRDVVALLLQLGDGALDLRDGGRDVRQLDDVGLGLLHQLAEGGQLVVDPLLLGQSLRELGDDATGERNVAGLDVDAGLGGERLDDGLQRIRRQQGSLVGAGPDDRGHVVGSPIWCRIRGKSTNCWRPR